MGSPVMADRRRTNMILGYLVALVSTGIIVIVATVLADFGGAGYAVGGFLMVGGLAGLGGLRASGGAWTAACPSCGVTMSSAQFGDEAKLHDHKVVLCPNCRTYLRGTDSLVVVEDGYVHPSPVFQAPLPERFQWPNGCQVCAGPATRAVHVEGRSFAGSMAGVAGVGVSTVVSVSAPACEAHQHEPVWLARTETGPVIHYRSIELWKRFRVRNELP